MPSINMNMKHINGVRKAGSIGSSIFAIIIGMTIFAGGLLFFLSGNRNATYAETEGVISFFEAKYAGVDSDGFSEYDYTVLVDYTVDGVEYEKVPYNAYYSGMEEGVTVKILYNVDNPAEIKAPSTDIVTYAAMAIGACVVLFGVISVVRVSRMKVSAMDGCGGTVSSFSVTTDHTAPSENETEGMNRYIFHYDGHLKQGYLMKTGFGEVVYEGIMEKLTFFTPFTFAFVNHLTHTTVRHKIGHTVSTAVGNGSFNMTTSSRFKIDGQNIWDYFTSKGLSMDVSLQGITMCYTIKQYGETIGFCKSAGTNVMTGKNYAAGNIPANGIYEVQCRPDDIDLLFLVCVAVTRAPVYGE